MQAAAGMQPHRVTREEAQCVCRRAQHRVQGRRDRDGPCRDRGTVRVREDHRGMGRRRRGPRGSQRGEPTLPSGGSGSSGRAGLVESGRASLTDGVRGGAD